MNKDDDFREKRAFQLLRAKGSKIHRLIHDKYFVPSQSKGGAAGYTVDVVAGTCECEDFYARGRSCKHLFCLSAALARGLVTDSVPDDPAAAQEKPAMPKFVDARDWRLYNQAQQEERALFPFLARALLAGIQQPVGATTGRPLLRLADVVFALLMKVFNRSSARRIMSDLRRSRNEGHIAHVASFNSILRYQHSPALTPLLKALIADSALPMAALETERQFAVDATGFATNAYGSYCDATHGFRNQHRYIKVHALVGTKTHVVYAAAATHENEIGGHEHSAKVLPVLLKDAAARGVSFAEVSADAEYLHKRVAQIIGSYGAVPYIDFRKDSTGTDGPEAWNMMFHSIRADLDLHLKHYHRRSNIEATFHAIKRVLGDRLKARHEVSQCNEALLILLAHNIRCIANAVSILGLEAKFERFSKRTNAA